MCGITGKISFGNQFIFPKEIKKMTDSIAHRGPDDEGFWISKNKKIGLGHRRLAIIDLSPAGHQPMSYRNRYHIVFNGEIYNFQSEKEKLIKLGYTFKSKTDTEVILALYDKYREKCLDHLRGMFSFAIYDEKENILFCARDRVGKKPFKYFYDKKVFIFASELKAILTQYEYHKEPDFEAIHHYLTLQYVPAPMTGFKNIFKLEPAHYLKLDLNNNTLVKKRYWRLDYSKKLNLPEEEWQKKIISKLDESVKIRMISDVPLGAFLSGGIDSSAVVGLMSKHSLKPVKTFSIGFEDEKYNELKYARIIADKFKTDHTEFIVKPDAIEVLPMLVKQYEEPYADSSALPTYYVSKLTRDSVTVALNGDGGDENFAGYERYSIQKFSLIYEKFRFINRLVCVPIIKYLSNKYSNTLFDRSYKFASTFDQNYDYRYLNYICYFSNEMKQKLYSQELKKKLFSDSYLIIANAFNDSRTDNKLDQTLYADFTNYLPEDLLVKVDIATMAVSLEGRSPFLDHEFLELTARIPSSLKLKGFNNKKYILKKSLEGFIPNEIMYRPKKGFGVPIDKWFKNDLNNYIRGMLLSDKTIIKKYFNLGYIEYLINAHQNTKLNYSNQLWALLTLELWFREYFD